MGRRAVYVVDGEHYPPVLRAAIGELSSQGTQPLAIVVAGGGEKLADPTRAPDLGAPTVVPEWAESALPGLLQQHQPDVVIDLSGEPVVTPTRRNALAAICLARGVPYETPGWRVEPPDLPSVDARSSVAVIATGKRTGKTAISGALARHAGASGRDPTVVAMGRGGPPEPVVLEPGVDLSTLQLLEASRGGRHAASDFYEDAVTSGARTVGCLRVGDGPSGQVGHTNVPAGVEAALGRAGDLLILEGSGAALPPVMPHAAALIVPATANLRDLAAGLPLRMLLADIVLLTFAGKDAARRGAVDAVQAEVRRLLADLPESARPHGGSHPSVIATDFRPRPLEDISGRRVALVTTARAEVNERIATALEQDSGAQVVAASSSLANRPKLREDLQAMPEIDAVVVELKAAAVDTVMEWAQQRNVPAVVLDHQIVAADSDAADMAAHFDRLIKLADARRGRDGDD